MVPPKPKAQPPQNNRNNPLGHYAGMEDPPENFVTSKPTRDKNPPGVERFGGLQPF